MYISYQFYKQPSHESIGREQGSDVFWDDINVVLLGTLDKGGLAEYLQGPRFEIEVHDRDRKIEQKKPKPSLFGENAEDEMINNVSLVAGKSTGELSNGEKAANCQCYSTNFDDLSNFHLT